MKPSFSVLVLETSSGRWGECSAEKIRKFPGKYIYLASRQENPDLDRIGKMLTDRSCTGADLIIPAFRMEYPEDESWEEPQTGSASSIFERFRCPPLLFGCLIRKSFLLDCLEKNPKDWIHAVCPELLLLIACPAKVCIARTDYLYSREVFTLFVREFHKAVEIFFGNAGTAPDIPLLSQLLRYDDFLMDHAVRMNLSSDEIRDLFDPETVVYNYFTRHPQFLNQIRLPKPSSVAGTIRNVALFCWGLRSGGIERVASLLLSHWASLNRFKLYMILDSPRQSGDYPCPDQAEIIILPKEHYSRCARERLLFQEKQIDCCIFFDYYSPAYFFDILTAARAGMKTVAMIHSVFFSIFLSNQPELLALRKAVYPSVDMVTCLSRSDECFLNQMGIHARYMPNPLMFDTSARPPFSERKNKTLIFIARQTPQKGTLDALRAVEIVRKKHPEVKLLMLGAFTDPAFEKTVKAYVREHDLAGTVEFAGFISDITKYIEQASLYVMPSSVEGWCLTALETKSFGLPTITYEMPYLETLRDEYGTISVPQGDYRAMAEKVSELLDDFGRLNELGRMAHDCLSIFDNQVVFARWQLLFEYLETGVEPPELSMPPLSAEQKLNLLEIQTNGILSSLMDLHASEGYREKIFQQTAATKRHENLLFDFLMRIYFILRRKKDSRFFIFAWNFTLNWVWRMKRIYRHFRPWQDEEQNI